jgi:hypothetical protein
VGGRKRPTKRCSERGFAPSLTLCVERRKGTIVIGILFIGLIVIIFVFASLLFVRRLNDITGRESRRRHSTEASRHGEHRVPCPKCAERILPEARVCPFCKSEVK